MKHIFKLMIIAVICACMTLAFTACSDPIVTDTPTPGPSDGQSDAPEIDTELEYLRSGDEFRLYHWWLQPGQEEDEFSDDSIVSRYRQNTMSTLKNDYGVTIKFIPNTGSYWDQVRSSAYSGEPLADGMHGGSVANAIDHYWYLELPGSCLEPISDHNISFDDDAYWDVEQQKEFCTFNGKLYGFVMNTVGMKSVETAKVTFFNYNLIQSAGYTPSQLYQMVKDKTWNWEIFEDICSKVTDPDRGIYGTTWYDLGLQLAMSNNGKIVTESKNGDVFTGYDANSTKAWDFLKGLYDNGYTLPLTEGTYDQDIVGQFKSGNVAFMINHWRRSWDSGRVIENCGWLPVPMGPDATDYVSEELPGECFVIFKGCNNPDGLLKTMKMLYRPIYAKGSADNDQLFNSEVALYCEDQDSINFLYYLQDITVQSKAVYYGINWQYMGLESTSKILTGEVSASQYFESVAPVYNEMIDKVTRRDLQS